MMQNLGIIIDKHGEYQPGTVALPVKPG